MTPCNTIGQSEAELSNPDQSEPGPKPGGNFVWWASATITTEAENAFLSEPEGSSYSPGRWLWVPASPVMIADSCGWNPFCNFLGGFGNLFRSGGNRRRGIAQLAGAEVTGVGSIFGAAAAVGPATEFGSDALAYGYRAAMLPYNNPELVEALRQFVEGMDAIVPTRWGAAGAAGKILWDHRGSIQNPF